MVVGSFVVFFSLILWWNIVWFCITGIKLQSALNIVRRFPLNFMSTDKNVLHVEWVYEWVDGCVYMCNVQCPIFQQWRWWWRWWRRRRLRSGEFNYWIRVTLWFGLWYEIRRRYDIIHYNYKYYHNLHTVTKWEERERERDRVRLACSITFAIASVPLYVGNQKMNVITVCAQHIVWLLPTDYMMCEANALCISVHWYVLQDSGSFTTRK